METKSTSQSALPKIRTFAIDRERLDPEVPHDVEAKDTDTLAVKETVITPKAKAATARPQVKPIPAPKKPTITTADVPLPIPPAFHTLQKSTTPNTTLKPIPKKTQSTDDITIESSDSDYANTTIIRDTVRRRSNVFGAIGTSIANLGRDLRKMWKRANQPLYVIPDTERRKGVIQQATSQTGKNLTADYERLKERLRQRVQHADSVNDTDEDIIWTPYTEPGFDLLPGEGSTSQTTTTSNVRVEPKRTHNAHIVDTPTPKAILPKPTQPVAAVTDPLPQTPTPVPVKRTVPPVVPSVVKPASRVMTPLTTVAVPKKVVPADTSGSPSPIKQSLSNAIKPLIQKPRPLIPKPEIIEPTTHTDLAAIAAAPHSSVPAAPAPATRTASVINPPSEPTRTMASATPVPPITPAPPIVVSKPAEPTPEEPIIDEGWVDDTEIISSPTIDSDDVTDERTTRRPAFTISQLPTNTITVAIVGGLIAVSLITLVGIQVITYLLPTSTQREAPATAVSLTQVPIITIDYSITDAGTLTSVLTTALQQKGVQTAEVYVSQPAGTPWAPEQLLTALDMSVTPALKAALTELRFIVLDGEIVGVTFLYTNPTQVRGSLLAWEPSMNTEITKLLPGIVATSTPFSDRQITGFDIRVQTENGIAYGLVSDRIGILARDMTAFQAIINIIK